MQVAPRELIIAGFFTGKSQHEKLPLVAGTFAERGRDLFVLLSALFVAAALARACRIGMHGEAHTPSAVTEPAPNVQPSIAAVNIHSALLCRTPPQVFFCI
jgi:hypothetical protein